MIVFMGLVLVGALVYLDSMITDYSDSIGNCIIQILFSLIIIAVIVLSLRLQEKEDKENSEAERRMAELKWQELKQHSTEKEPEKEASLKDNTASFIADIHATPISHRMSNFDSDNQGLDELFDLDEHDDVDEYDELDAFKDLDNLEPEPEYKLMGYESKENYEFDNFVFDKMMWDQFHDDL